MNFLLTNDDGIFSDGLKQLAAALRSLGTIYVAAPDRERSAIGHAITLHRPLRVQRTSVVQGTACYSIDGTPADCVKLALQGLQIEPDVLIAGINAGSNLGTDVLYSGTVAAAMEASILGVPSMAISLCEDAHGRLGDYDAIAPFLPDLLAMLSDLAREQGGSTPVLNVNVPSLPTEKIRGLQVTRLGFRSYQNVFEEMHDPRGKQYYWMGGQAIRSREEGLDDLAIAQGYISITPLNHDITNTTHCEMLHRWMQDQ